LVTESKAINVVRLGDIAIRPGELPALILLALNGESISPSMRTKPGKATGLAALCEARTRVVSVLGGLDMVGPLPPQETRPKLASKSRARKRTTVFESDFKRRSPNNLKDGDLGAKYRIIADPEIVIIRMRRIAKVENAR
jgi:hypothetical protein